MMSKTRIWLNILVEVDETGDGRAAAPYWHINDKVERATKLAPGVKVIRCEIATGRPPFGGSDPTRNQNMSNYDY